MEQDKQEIRQGIEDEVQLPSSNTVEAKVSLYSKATREELKRRLKVTSKEFIYKPFEVQDQEIQAQEITLERAVNQSTSEQQEIKIKKKKKRKNKQNIDTQQQLNQESIKGHIEDNLGDNIVLNGQKLSSQNINFIQRTQIGNKNTKQNQQNRQQKDSSNNSEQLSSQNSKNNSDQVKENSKPNVNQKKASSQSITKKENNLNNHQTDQANQNIRNKSLGKSINDETNKETYLEQKNTQGAVGITEKEKQKKQGYYSKINYNLSEIIQKQIIPIKIEEQQKNKNSQNQQEQNIIDSISVHVLGKKPKKQQKKMTENKMNESNSQMTQMSSVHQNIDKTSQKIQSQSDKLKQKQHKQAKDVSDNTLNNEESKLDANIRDVKEELNKFKEQMNNKSSWEDAVILSEQQLKDIQKKQHILQQKLNDLQLKKDLILQDEQNKKKLIIQDQQERKKQRFLRKLKRLGHLKNIAKEIALFKKAKGIPHPKISRTTKYKAVPDNQLDFELIEKKKKKISKIKVALKTFRQSESATQDQDEQQKNKQKATLDDHFETVNEDSDEELSNQIDTDSNQIKKRDVKLINQLINLTNQKKCNQLKIKKFIDNEEQEEGENEDEGVDKQEQIEKQNSEKQVYTLPSYINEQHNLDGVKYNNMKLRAWVDHMPDKSIDDKVLSLINDLSYKQAMKKLNEPKKFKKRIVAGFKEVLSTINTNIKDKKSKCIIISLNLEKNPFENGSDQLILEIINLAIQKKIPIIHSSSRARLGKAFTGKFGPRISVLSIINYEGLFDQVDELASLVSQKKIEYQNRYSNKADTLSNLIIQTI